tara:strand:+ start:52 stop:672 length:621 start_codon:yes stop_codon:yes gene_type:complete
MLRSDIINNFIKKYDYKSYLEIGYGNGDTFHKVSIPMADKIGVDGGNGTPLSDPYVTRMKADEYFALNKKFTQKTFDIIFIDASHLWEDVYNDLTNALDCLNEGGTIVMHDCNPPSKPWQERQQSPEVPGWTGDTWKAFVKFRTEREDLEMYVVDTDYGCGVVRTGTQDLLNLTPAEVLDYDLFEPNKQEWLNLCTVEQFLQRMKN